MKAALRNSGQDHVVACGQWDPPSDAAAGTGSPANNSLLIHVLEINLPFGTCLLYPPQPYDGLGCGQNGRGESCRCSSCGPGREETARASSSTAGGRSMQVAATASACTSAMLLQENTSRGRLGASSLGATHLRNYLGNKAFSWRGAQRLRGKNLLDQSSEA